MSREEPRLPTTHEEMQKCLRDLEMKLEGAAPGARRDWLLDDAARLRSFAVLKQLD